MDLFWTAVAGLIAVAGPWKAGVFLAESTAVLPRRERLLTAFYTVGFATVIGVAFVVVGEPILEFFHIDEAAFLIAAGLLVVVFSVRLVLQDVSHDDAPPPDPGARAVSLAAFPLSFPFVISPPAIASLVALGVIAHLDDESLAVVIAAVVAVQAFNLVVFVLLAAFADRVNTTLFEVAGRLLAVILTAFGVSVLIDGLRLIEVV